MIQVDWLFEPYNFTGMVVSAQAAISGPFSPPTRPGNEASLLSWLVNLVRSVLSHEMEHSRNKNN